MSGLLVFIGGIVVATFLGLGVLKALDLTAPKKRVRK